MAVLSLQRQHVAASGVVNPAMATRLRTHVRSSGSTDRFAVHRLAPAALPRRRAETGDGLRNLCGASVEIAL